MISSPAAVAVESRRRAGAGKAPPRPRTLVALVALAAALWAVVCSAWAFPHLSDNNDEAAYLLQADSLRHGRLFPPAVEPAEAFLPWLSAHSGDHYVSKYLPVHASVIASAHKVFGSDRAALALIAAAAVAACYLLAREVLARRREAVLAAGFLVASPLFLIQSATYLAYLSTLTLLMGFAASLLAGTRRRHAGRLALAGLLLGTALFARPFDTLLFAGPFAVWWAWARREPLRSLAREAGWITLGAVLPVLTMFGYYRAATGSFFRSPFTLPDPSDTLGFGLRRMFPAQPALDYTPDRALQGLVRLAALSGFWIFGGLLIVALVFAGLRGRPVRHRGRPDMWLALVAVTVPLGYALFWGSYSSTIWGGPWRFGPFYWYALLVPASILGAAGFGRLWRWDRLVAGLVAVGMVAVSALVVGRALGQHRQFSAARERLYAGPLQAQSADVGRAVVFLPPLQGPWLLQPFAFARNATFDGPVVWALEHGQQEDLAVIRRFPDRTPYRVVAHGGTTRLERIAVTGERRSSPRGGSR